MTSKNMLGAAAALVLALATGCAILEGQEWTPDPASDAGIQAAAAERLSRDAVTADANLLVTVENGLATLTGNVPSEAVRQRAIQILENTDGIFEVRDHTRIF